MSLAKAKIKFWDWIVFYGIPIVLLLLYVLLGPYKAHGQTFQPNAQAYPPEAGPFRSGQFYVLPIDPAPMVPSGTAFPNQGTGTTAYFYWVVTNDVDNSISSIPAGPFVTTVGPASLAANQSITVQWQVFTLPLVYGATNVPGQPLTTSNVTYDVLETSDDVPPSGACGCAVATGLTNSSAVDTGSYSPYTVAVPAWPTGYPTPGHAASFGVKGLVIDAGFPITAGIGTFTVATLPTGQAVNTLAIVSDASPIPLNQGFNCAVGGGTGRALCQWTGTVWQYVGAAFVAGNPNDVQFADISGLLKGVDSFQYIESAQSLRVSQNNGSAYSYESVCDSSCANGNTISALSAVGVTDTAREVGYADVEGLIESNADANPLGQLNFRVFRAPNPFVFLSIHSNGDITLPGLTSGSAAIGVQAVAGTPNRVNLPTVTGAPGAVLITDGGNPQNTSWSLAPSHPLLAYSVTTETADTALTNGSPSVVITKIVTMPSTGCPCRISAIWLQYITSTGAGQTADLFVSDGTNKFAEGEREVDIIGNAASQTGSGYSPVTYANSAVVTFTLTIQVNGLNTTARAASFQSLGMRNSRLELAVFPSN